MTLLVDFRVFTIIIHKNSNEGGALYLIAAWDIASCSGHTVFPRFSAPVRVSAPPSDKRPFRSASILIRRMESQNYF